MRICVLGTGYVGLVAGACFSDSGNHVVCADVDSRKVEKLQAGQVPIYEPGLDELVSRNRKANRLSFTTDVSSSISKSQVIFIAVGTPTTESGALDLTYVLSAAKMIRENIKGSTVVVLKSTVPVGTADKVREVLKGGSFQVEVVSNPEFLKEGTAVNDFMKPERVVVGTQSEWAKQVMADLYAPYVRSGNPIFFMDNRSAELAKYAANAFLATKISFINEMANLCERVGGNIQEVRKVLVTDSRIGSKFLYPGCGYGGSCFPKDVQGLIHLGKEYGLGLDMFRAVHSVNEKQKLVLLEKMKKYFGSTLPEKTVAVWGLAFKPETDDMREAPAVSLINELLKMGCKVKAYDPVARHEAKNFFKDQVELVQQAYDVLSGADALAILTEWNEFRTPDFEIIKRELKNPVVFDGRNLYSRASLENQGLKYYCIGQVDPA
ncbi:MAG: UDP-glucose/GDP-mannose dehydrogenase family protein [Proteobacteria bacterium]|nr:UDP-glucose/GDP-mannose dehydrogenase family protein [Pseudomonadota bacterium]